jgi:hypothetical protein
MTPEDIENGAGVAWGKVREICQKHGVEFVESRREMAEYIARAKLVPDDLLNDHNHQNVHGRIRIWDNVSRHLAESRESSYRPEARERWLAMPLPVLTDKEQVTLSGDWQLGKGLVHASKAGPRLKVTFTGNQIDLVGRKTPGGGSVKVLIDGVPGDQEPAFLTDYIQPNKRNWRIPHAVELGAAPVPQAWTITMTNDTGDFRLDGSVTGADGSGNLAEPFTSKSGQIKMDPKYWRQGRVEKKGQPVDYGVASGDTFSFHVYRSVVGQVNFQGESTEHLVEPLGRNLSNQQHTVEIIPNGDGEVTIEGLYIFEPPEK